MLIKENSMLKSSLEQAGDQLHRQKDRIKQLEIDNEQLKLE